MPKAPPYQLWLPGKVVPSPGKKVYYGKAQEGVRPEGLDEAEVGRRCCLRSPITQRIAVKLQQRDNAC
jgi:hypothetical protein